MLTREEGENFNLLDNQSYLSDKIFIFFVCCFFKILHFFFFAVSVRVRMPRLPVGCFSGRIHRVWSGVRTWQYESHTHGAVVSLPRPGRHVDPGLSRHQSSWICIIHLGKKSLHVFFIVKKSSFATSLDEDFVFFATLKIFKSSHSHTQMCGVCVVRNSYVYLGSLFKKQAQ